MRRNGNRALLCTFGAVLLSTVASTASAQLVLPLQPGQAVATCRDGNNGNAPAPYVVGVIDVRDPVCNAPGLDQNWSAPMYHNEANLSPTGNPADEWTASNLGQVFGVALDNAANPNIYVTSTSSYPGVNNATGNVYKLDGTTGAIQTLATLPNTGPGLGQVAFDRGNNQLFVTNHEDGTIYRIGADGTVLEAFDPFGADDGAAGFAPLGERLFGVQVYGCHLYFGRWNEHFNLFGNPGVWVGTGLNEVYSVEIDGSGAIVGPPVLQLTMPANNQGHSHPVADIAFSADGNMMLAEKGMWDDDYAAPHAGRLLEYSGGHSAWALNGNTYDVGGITGVNNSTGGVDYDCASADACNAGGHVLATGDALHCCSAPNNIYGLQLLPAGGGTLANSYLVDFDNDTIFQDKTAIGDIDSVRDCYPEPVECPSANPCDDINNATIVGTAGDDYLLGTEGPDVIFGLAGNDIILGKGGDDVLCGGDGKDSLLGGAGDDIIYGDGSYNWLKGGAGDDTLYGGDDGNEIQGQAGNDFVFGGAGNDTLYGGGDSDVVVAGAGNDTVYGNDGDDELLGEAGNDWMSGGAGDDCMDGGEDNDRVRGDAGDDCIDGGDGIDQAVCGAGNDTYSNSEWDYSGCETAGACMCQAN